MASNYPTSLDNFTNPTSNDSLNSPSHSLQHADINDAVEAIEAKLGIGASSAGSATAGHVLTAGTGGTTTWSAPSIAGLVQIVPASVTKGASGSASVATGGAVTFSGTESISLNTCFSSTYQNYRIIVNLSNQSGNTTTNLRFRVGTTDTSANYNWGHLWVKNNSSTGGYGGASAGEIRINYINATAGHTSLDVVSPFETRETQVNVSGWGTDGTPFSVNGGGNQTGSTSFDGFTIFPGSGTISGSIRIYGYRNGA